MPLYLARWLPAFRRSGLERLLVLGCALIATVLVYGGPARNWLHGQGFDGMMALNTQLPDVGPADPPDVVIVAIDEETHRTSPFAGKPWMLWTPHLARVQDEVMQAGAALMAWDIIVFATLKGLLADPQYESKMLKSLGRWGLKENKIILAKAGTGPNQLNPDKFLLSAAGGVNNLRSVNVSEDADSIIRKMPASVLLTDGHYEPVLAVEMAARYRQQSAESLLAPVGGMTSALYPYFTGREGAYPTYSLADLYACAEQDNKDFFRQNFAGKLVLLGMTVDVEDRKLTAARWVANKVQNQPAPRCALAAPPPRGAASVLRDSISGVYLHAAMIDNFLHGPLLRPANTNLAWVLMFMAALAGATVPLLRHLAMMPLTLMALVGVQGLAAILTLQHGIILPGLEMVVATILAAILMFGTRYVLIDSKRRKVQQQFEKYVSPNFVRELIEHPERINTSGEKRVISFLFTDLEGFTSLVERSNAEELRPLLNAYLDGIISEVFAHGGTVDKIVGDAVVAMFGAPLANPDHHRQAYQAALAIDRYSEKFRAEKAAQGIELGVTRIGVNSGPAVIGDFGGSNLFDYTALGNAINTAARLESANKYFGSRICISNYTVRNLTSFTGRHIGNVIVKGTRKAMVLFDATPLPGGEAQRQAYELAYAQLAVDQQHAVAAFEALLRDYPNDRLAKFHLDRLQAGETGQLVVLKDK